MEHVPNQPVASTIPQNSLKVANITKVGKTRKRTHTGDTTDTRGIVMAHARNLFTPTLGMVPPHMAGRGRILSNMQRAFAEITCWYARNTKWRW